MYTFCLLNYISWRIPCPQNIDFSLIKPILNQGLTGDYFRLECFLLEVSYCFIYQRSSIKDFVIDTKNQTLLTDDTFYVGAGYRVLLSLRRIAHAMDTHSRKLVTDFNITGPQLLCLYTISKHMPVTLSRLSAQLSLSAGTVNGIIDRLEAKSLITRRRDRDDRRKIWLEPTARGIELVGNAHNLLHQTFADRLGALPDSEQAAIARCLETVVELMALDTLPDR